MKILRVVIVFLVLVVLLALSSWLIIAFMYLNIAGIIVQGEVIGKQESIVMRGGDRWQHIFEVTYRYQPLDSHEAQTGTHQIDPSLYSRLQIGSPVQVRYSPWRALRPLNEVGSALVDSSWFSRIPHKSDDARSLVELAALGAVLLLALVAYKWKSRSLGLVAALGGATVLSGILLLGFIVFPALFWLWRRFPGKGFGWVLLASAALSTVVLYWRIPWPTPMPPGPQHNAAATVHQVQVVKHIWTTWRNLGQDLWQPFQMVDLEFTPEGAVESVHILDRVDLSSVAGLSEGATVQVSYPPSNPRAGRIAGASRTYAQQALLYVLGLTYAIAAALILVALPVVSIAGRLSRRFPVFGVGMPPDKVLRQISALPVDDPRRKALEEFVRTRNNRQEKDIGS